MQSGSYRADGDAAMAGSFNAATRKIIRWMGVCLCIRRNKGRRAAEGCPRLPSALGGLQLMRVG